MKNFFTVLLLLPLFFSQCYAEGIMAQAADLVGAEAIYENIPDDAKIISGSLEENGTYDTQGALKRLWHNVLQKLQYEIESNIKSFFSLVVTALLCALCFCLCKDKTVGEYINVAGVCAVAVMFTQNVDGLVNETVQALIRIDNYSKAAMPAIFTAAAAGGAVLGSSARYAAVSLGLDVIMNTAQKTIVPLIYCFLALSLSKGLFDNPLIKSIQHFIKWLIGILLTTLTLVFSAYISITGAVSGSVDALAVKTTRTVISNALPVVGGMISDAASTVLTAANMIKSSAGALSLVAVCALCAGPFVLLSVKMLLFRLASAACDMVPGVRLSAFLNDIGTALSILLGLLGSVSIMLFISIMSVIKAVTG